MHVCSQLIIFVNPNEKRRRKYDAKHVKINIFLPSFDLVNWQTYFLTNVLVI
jgi:hypothetical protein